MGSIVTANTAAAALLRLQMLQGQESATAQGLKRRIVSEDEEAGTARVRSRSTNSDVAEDLVEETKLCDLCDALPEDVLAQCLSHLSSFQDIASASGVCKRWREGIRQALACQGNLNFSGWRPDNAAISRLVERASNLQELNISNGRWGCRISDAGLLQISSAKCCPHLTSISLWGVTAITDEGVVQLVMRAESLQYFNVGGTFITDVSILAIASHCKLLKCINLWCCRHVTETGLLALIKGCPDLEFMNVWGMSISPSCRRLFKLLNTKLELKPQQADHLV